MHHHDVNTVILRTITGDLIKTYLSNSMKNLKKQSLKKLFSRKNFPSGVTGFDLTF
jgi:hypothetical protein